MREPGGRLPATPEGRGQLRASDSDRERVIEILKGAFARGQLTMGEFDTRVGQTLGARTYAELAALTDGISAGRTAARPVRSPGPGPARAALSPRAARAALGPGPARAPLGLGAARAPLGKAASSCAGVIMAAVRRAGCLHLAVNSGEERTRVAGFPLDPSGRQRVLGYPPG